MKPPIKVLFASGSQEANALVLGRMQVIYPDLPLFVVSEFRPSGAGFNWIPYHIHRTPQENLELVQWHLREQTVRLGAVILEPRIPHGALRRLGFKIAGLNTLIFNENGEHFMLRPRSIPAMFDYLRWRAKNLLVSQFKKGGYAYEARRLLSNAEERRLSILYRRVIARGKTIADSRQPAPLITLRPLNRPQGLSVVIPSRNGLDLLRTCLPRLAYADEIIVIDNGSSDQTEQFLKQEFPSVIVETNSLPLSFASAVNRGIAKARFSHVCLLNNDMLVEPGFLQSLYQPFTTVADLFCSSAQIFFPAGQRREETGITVLTNPSEITDFPIRCNEPLEGEDGSYVLYGSGGCSLYDADKLAALGGFDESYQPAYVEDLDLGVRAWLRGWSTVYAAEAKVLHHHRATTSRYFTPEQLDLAVELNHARFLTKAIPGLDLWNKNTLRLKVQGNAPALAAIAKLPVPPFATGDTSFFPLVDGSVSVFPGHAPTGKPVVLVASPYLPYPLSHGAAVRIYNLMRRSARDFDQVLVCFVEESRPVPRELLDICVEVVIVRRPGTHALPSTPRPDTVEEFDSPAFHLALRQMASKWRPGILQLEFTQMAIYRPDVPQAKALLVEHDITYDLFAQMLAREDDWETRRQYDKWVRFEKDAWRQVDRVVTMSDKDRQVAGANAVTIANGVDLERFQAFTGLPEPRRLLFIGSFAHKPNVLALEFFLEKVFPRLHDVTLHVIAGQRHERFWDLKHPGVELDGFVSDVRPAYGRAAIVIAPLVASAGTNIKIMEAMAMGKAIVSTEAGIHGLEVDRGHDAIVTDDPLEMAAAISHLLDHLDDRRALEWHARQTAERIYGWDAIAERQKQLYEDLLL